MKRVAFLGPGVVGRRTSLGLLVERFGERSRSWVCGNDDYLLSVHGMPVVAFVASKRSLFGDPGNVQVAEEFERVAASDGYIFVVDSQIERLEAGLEELALLRSDLHRRRIDLDAIPVVFQLNKRDLGTLSVAELRTSFATKGCAYVESIATRGTGVVEAFELLGAMMKS